MRRSIITAVVAGLLLPAALVAAPASATITGNEGCTPGYWKNHPESWLEAPGVPVVDPSRNPTLGGATNPANEPFPRFETRNVSLDTTFMEALSFRGGPGAAGAERILLRAAVAAWLNAANEGLGYPLRRRAFVPEVNSAIASGNRATMLDLASKLDAANNLGCPLN